jgi:hypothetical protein
MDLFSLEYPRYLHRPSRWDDWQMLRVDTPEDCAAALADGWSVEARLLDDRAAPDPVIAVASCEAPVKRGPGRPRKVQP